MIDLLAPHRRKLKKAILLALIHESFSNAREALPFVIGYCRSEFKPTLRDVQKVINEFEKMGLIKQEVHNKTYIIVV